MFNLETFELEEHHPDYRMLNMASMSYREGAGCPRFMQFLDETIPKEDDRLLFQVFFGIALSNTPCDRHEQYLWLHGASGGGKSTYVRVLRELLGGRMQTLKREALKTRDTGYSFDPTGNSCVVFEDLKCDDQVHKDVEALVTTYLSDDAIKVRKLYEDAFPVPPKGALMFTSNDPPHFFSTGDGGFRRMREVPFFNTPSTPDRRLIDKLKAERDGIFLWALEGLRYYRETGDLPPYTENEMINREELKSVTNDSVERFCGMLEYDAGERMYMEEAWNRFKAATGENEKSVAVGLFQRRFRKHLPVVLRRHPNELYGRDARRYCRVKLRKQ